MDLKKEVKEEFIRFQRNEKTESIVYERLASIEKDESNRKVAYSQILLAGKNPGYYICH